MLFCYEFWSSRQIKQFVIVLSLFIFLSGRLHMLAHRNFLFPRSPFTPWTETWILKKSKTPVKKGFGQISLCFVILNEKIETVLL